METGSPSRMPANTTRKKGTRSRSVSGFWLPPHSRLGVPGGSRAGMAETVSAFKKPRISAVIGRFDRAQPTEHRILWEGRHDDRPSNDASNCHR